MRLGVIRFNQRHLAQGAAIVILGGLVSGCSSDAMRFTYGTDGMFTGATANQRQIISQDQPYPGDRVPAASVDGSHTGSVARDAVKPVDLAPQPVAKTELAPVAAPAAAAPAPAPVIQAEAPKPAPKLEAPVQTASAAQAAAPVAAAPEPVAEDPVGWSKAGGTQVTAKQGETVYNLSRRFGVPADVLMKMNGISPDKGLQAGQKIVIPTYVYNSKAPVSAPDSDPKVADAKSSRGNKSDLPANVPIPGNPRDNVAVLPKSPKLKEGDAAQPVEASNDKAANGGKAVAKAEPQKAEKPEQVAKAEKPKVEEPVKAAAGAYKVQSGDTLSKIAKKNGVSVAALKKANGLEDGVLKVGQSLKLPAGGEQAVAAAKPSVDPVVTGAAGPAKKAEGAQVAAYTPPAKPQKSIEDADVDTASAAPNSTGIGKMRWPVRGRVIGNFGKGGGRSNDGIDIAVPEGTPIKAAENGVVIYAGDGLKDFGNTVLVRHDNGLVTVYGHASELDVKRGDKVKRGQEIARSGMSGTTDTPKLHFEVRKNSAPIDPSSYLE